jgi:hypothetical protein
MNTTKIAPIRLFPTKRREYVALPINAGKSNRAVATELNVDEGTIRRDRKFLATPENERPVKLPRPKKLTKVSPVRELDPAELRRRYVEYMVEVLQSWIGEQSLILPDIEYVLEMADKHLHEGRSSVSRLPESPHNPVELLPLTRPNRVVEDYMPAKLDYCAEWLARWLACCLPRDEELQDEVRHLTAKWARS